MAMSLSHGLVTGAVVVLVMAVPSAAVSTHFYRRLFVLLHWMPSAFKSIWMLVYGEYFDLNPALASAYGCATVSMHVCSCDLSLALRRSRNIKLPFTAQVDYAVEALLKCLDGCTLNTPCEHQR